MAVYETTATMIQDTVIHSNSPNTEESQRETSFALGNTGAVIHRGLFSWLVPSKPIGADAVNRVTAVLAFRSRFAPGPSAQRSQTAYKISRPWTEASASYNYFDGVGNAWTTAGGDKDELISSTKIAGSPTYGATFVWDVTSASNDWGKRGNILIQDSAESGSAATSTIEYFGESVATVAWKPHIVVNFTDNAPDAINDLTVSPDLSLSEASYTFRQRATLKWTASDANDFFRYRIRYGINRSLAANHTQKAFVNSRGSTSYLDATDYTNGSTVYYSIYVEDQRNQSASTNANVSNILSWKKPRLVSFTLSPGSPVDVLAQVTCSAIPSDTTNETKALVYWGDGSKSVSETFNSGGTAIQAYHRFTKATAASVVRVQIEDLNGFRSNFGGQSLSRTISSPGPIAKIVASPSRQRTAGTFAFGNLASIIWTTGNSGRLIINHETKSPTDGVGTRFRTRATSTTGTFYAQLWRLEDSRYRCIYSDLFSTSTNAQNIGRDINWLVKKGDMVGIHGIGLQIIEEAGGGGGGQKFITTGTTFTPGSTIPKWRFGSNPNVHAAHVSLAYTNPIHFSAKDSFARGSNKFINRFRWAANYDGDDLGDLSIPTLNTGATTSFYYAWTTATTQFVGVKAVDNSHASSIDIAGVVIETESTFRFPDDLRDGVNAQIRDSRSRAYTQSYALSKDYGTLDLGALGPRSLALSGTAYSKATSSTSYIDIDRVHGVFQQRKRCYVHLPGKSTSSAVQGYVVDAPNIYSTDDPDAAGWDLTIVVAT